MTTKFEANSNQNKDSEESETFETNQPVKIAAHGLP
jgi:hypothetical protein